MNIQKIMLALKQNDQSEVAMFIKELATIKDFLPCGVKLYKFMFIDELMLFFAVPNKVAKYKNEVFQGIQWRFKRRNNSVEYSFGCVENDKWWTEEVLSEFPNLKSIFEAIEWVEDEEEQTSQLLLMEKSGVELPIE